MFAERAPTGDLAALRESVAPSVRVLDAGRDFETLRPEVAENLLAVVDGVDPLAYDAAWVPGDAPDVLHRLAGDAFTVGAPGDGGVAWTRQTDPPTVFVKPRLEGSPEPFVAFLIAEAIVEIDLGLPEHFLGFFEAEYPALDDAVPLSPADTYQLAAALFDAYAGRHTRDVFATWDGEYPDLHEQWLDAGERLAPRLSGITGEVARGETGFAAAAELACSAVKHDLDLPRPFDALDTAAYGDHGAPYAVRWAEKTFDALAE